jgi:hypothetical protein
MKVDEKWRRLGWRHPLWDYVRFYTVVRGQQKELRDNWLKNMRASKLEIVPGENIPIDPGHAQLFFEYLTARDKDFATAEGLLRTEEEALTFCTKMQVEAAKNVTQLAGYYQSSKSLIAGVTAVAKLVCDKNNLSFVPSPQRRCAWLVDNHLHVTARNLDGAIPDLANPSIVWEIKEYWGKTKGGSKMSDAVYECNLVGRELREFEERSGAGITHVVFVDGKEQWSYRQSDMKRFIDLFHQGLIDHLFVGRDVETEWRERLTALINARA